MKKAKIALSAIAVLGVIGSALAFKAVKRGGVIVFTTAAYNATATKTLTQAVAGSGTAKYYTFIDNQKAILRTLLTTAD